MLIKNMQIVRIIKKFGLILTERQKIRIFQLMVLMVIGGMLEMCSVSLILPFMNIVLEPEETMENKYVKIICDILNIQSPRTFLVLTAIILAIVYLLKNIYLILEYNVQYRFVYGNMFRTQRRVLSSFIHKPYEFFLHISSGEIMRIINNDTASAFGLLSTLLQVFTELVVSGMLIAAVFVITPELTVIIAAVLVLLVFFISKCLKPILRRAGEETQASSAGMNKWLLQSIQGIKEIKVMAKESFFGNNYNLYGNRYVSAARKSNLLSMLPRFLIEAISMCMMFMLVAFLIYKGEPLESIVPMLSAVALAAMRLLPSVNRVSSGLAAISYNEPMLDKLIENLKDISGGNDISLSMDFSDTTDVSTRVIKELKREICLADITYRYPDTEALVLNDTGFIIEKGQSVGIVGSSGSGKTTAVDILLGLLNPKSGKVLFDGISITEDMPGFLHQVGYIPQSIFLLDDSIGANVAFGEDHISDDKVWRALKDASMYDFVKSLPKGIHTQIGERGMRLSGGQRQRIGIARALYHNPGILVFDEATSALDNETEKSIMESIDHLKGHKTLVIIAHRLTTIENCDIVYRVENGKIQRERRIDHDKMGDLWD